MKEWNAAEVYTEADVNEELRVDPSDGCAYSRADFVEVFALAT